MKIFIDSHVHVLPPARLGGLMRWIKRAFPPHPVPENITAHDIVEDLRRRGVTHFFNLAYPIRAEETDSLNDFNLDFCARTPGAIPFASLHQDTPDKAEIGRRLLTGSPCVGFKFHPFVQRFDPWDRRMDPLYEVMQELGRPVLFHTGFGDFYQMEMPARELGALLKRFPRLPMVFVHMAFPEFDRVRGLLEDFPDLYLDATNVLACFRPQFRPWIEASPDGGKIQEKVLALIHDFEGRIMHGSDHPAGMGGLDEIYQDLWDLEMDPDARQSLKTGAAKAFIERFQPGFDWSRGMSKD